MRGDHDAVVKKGIRLYTGKGRSAAGWYDSKQSKGDGFFIAAEIERDLISKTTKEDLQAIKSSGGQLGRPNGPGKSKLDVYLPEIAF